MLSSLRLGDVFADDGALSRGLPPGQYSPEAKIRRFGSAGITAAAAGVTGTAVIEAAPCLVTLATGFGVLHMGETSHVALFP